MGMMQTNRDRDTHRLEATNAIPEGYRFHPDLGVTSESDVARYRRSLTPGQIALARLVAELRNIAQLTILSAVPIDESRTSPFWGKWYFRMDDAATMAVLVADECRSTGTPYLPLFETWSGRTDPKALLADGLQLNSFGHESLFQEVSAFLQRLFAQS